MALNNAPGFKQTCQKADVRPRPNVRSSERSQVPVWAPSGPIGAIFTLPGAVHSDVRQGGEPCKPIVCPAQTVPGFLDQLWAADHSRPKQCPGGVALGTAQAQGALWGARAREWADLQEAAFEPLYRDALEAAEVGEGNSVLDVGCGAGLAVVVARKMGAKVSGLDAAADLIGIAKSRTPEADLRVGELEELPFEDGAFDVVTGFNSFQYAADRVNALREARRVMQPTAGWSRQSGASRDSAR